MPLRRVRLQGTPLTLFLAGSLLMSNIVDESLLHRAEQRALHAPRRRQVPADESAAVRAEVVEQVRGAVPSRQVGDHSERDAASGPRPTSGK